MAQQLQNITIQAAGFAGVNTQDSPVGLDPSFASIADNCVIDQFGRIGARKGYDEVSTNGSSVLGSSRGIETLFEFAQRDGSKKIFSAGNNKIFQGDTTLAEMTYTGAAGYSPYCNALVSHFGGDPNSDIYITIENISATQIKVTITSADSTAVDDLIIPQTSPEYLSLSSIDTSVPNTMSRTITYSSPAPLGVTMNVLWSKAGFAGNWQLRNPSNLLSFPFTAVCSAGAPTITANNWKAVSFNDDVYFFQSGHFPIKYEASTNTLMDVSTDAPLANEVIAAYGRLWATDIVGNKHTVYWSDTLIGTSWTGGTSGSLDLTTVFPAGTDEIVALAAHNGFLIIFGRNSIVIYQGAESPASMTLYDTIQGVGCIARDSVQHTGTDIIFLSDDGLRSFGRTIQEKSMPMRDISKNVRNDLMGYVAQQTNPIKSLYSPEEAFYLLVLPDSNLTYCFDMRTQLPDGSNRVTTWTDITPLSLARRQDGTIYIGKSDGIYKYTGYLDDEQTYLMRYFSNPMDFGNTSNLKFLKKFNLTVIGNVTAQTTLNWGYDYSTNYNKQVFTTQQGNTPIAEYGTAEYGLSEYSTGIDIQLPSVNGTGSGSVVTVGIESTINGAPYSIQKIDIHALLGRLI